MRCSTAVGCRDIAILTLLVRLGLRRGEVAKLRLDDIDWRAGDDRSARQGKLYRTLPLPPDVGRSLAAVSAAGRPDKRPGPDGIRADQGASSRTSVPSGVSTIVADAARRAGLGRDPCASPAPYRGDADAARRRVAAGDRPTPASPPCRDDGDLRQGRPRRLADDRPPLAGRRSMSALRQALADYLAMRRALGYKLARGRETSRSVPRLRRGSRRRRI